MNTNRELIHSSNDDQYQLERQILRIFDRVFQPRVPIEWSASLRCYNITWDALMNFIETLNKQFNIRLTQSFADKCLSVGSLVQTICSEIMNKSPSSSCESFVSFTDNGENEIENSDSPITSTSNGNGFEVIDNVNGTAEMSVEEASAKIKLILQNIIGKDLSQMNAQTGFMSLGLSSIQIETFHTHIQKLTTTRLPSTVLFDYVNLASLASYLSNVSHGISQRQILQTISTTRDTDNNENVYIMGASCTMPGVNCTSVNDLWQAYKCCKNGISSLPSMRAQRLITAYNVTNDYLNTTSPMRRGGYIQQCVEQFDAPFFNISPREAVLMDPQQRLLLHETWKAMEVAGIYPQHTNCAMYVGIFTNDYNEIVSEQLGVTSPDSYYMSGSSKAMAAGRLSYVYDLQGPSMIVDTACSSSMVAFHLACKQLQQSDTTNMAIVAGVQLHFSPIIAASLHKANMLSDDFHCKTFAASANGFVRAEGCIAIVLQRLNDDSPQIANTWAHVLGCNTNQDGASSGLTAPNGRAQTNLIQQTFDSTQLNIDDVSYMEAHGTGTPIGDPIEMNSLRTVYNSKIREMIVGSGKAIHGHMEAAAGLSGLLKLLLTLKHNYISPLLHLDVTNKRLDVEYFNIALPHVGQMKMKPELGFIGCLNSFGFSGTNVHGLFSVKDNSNYIRRKRTQQNYVLLLSAESRVSLKMQIGNYFEFLATTNQHVGNICYTSQIQRYAFKRRLAIYGQSRVEIIQKLKEAASSTFPLIQSINNRAPFTLNSYYDIDILLLVQLYSQHSAFAQNVDKCLDIFEEYDDTNDLRQYFRIDECCVVRKAQHLQLAFIHLYALTNMYIQLGVEPASISPIGIVAEFVALTIAGVISLEDACRLVLTVERLTRDLNKDCDEDFNSACEAFKDVVNTIEIRKLATFPIFSSIDHKEYFEIDSEYLVNAFLNALTTTLPSVTPSAYSDMCIEISTDSNNSTDCLRGENVCAVLCQLWQTGFELNWKANHFIGQWASIPSHLPTYEFNTKGYWIAEKAIVKQAQITYKYPLTGDIIQFPGKESEFIWRIEIDVKTEEYQYLLDHIIDGKCILPAAAYIEIALQCGQQLHKYNNDCQTLQIQEMQFLNALQINVEQNTNIHIHASCVRQHEYELKIYSQNSQSTFTLHSQSSLLFRNEATKPHNVPFINGQLISNKHIYNTLSKYGYHYKDTFQTIDSLASDDNASKVTLNLHTDGDSYHLHPTVTDGALQCLAFAALVDDKSSQSLFYPFYIENMSYKLDTKYNGKQYTAAMNYSLTSQFVFGTCSIFDNSGNILLQMDGIRYKSAAKVEDKIPHQLLATIWKEATFNNTVKCELNETKIVHVDEHKAVNALIALLKDKNIKCTSEHINRYLNAGDNTGHDKLIFLPPSDTENAEAVTWMLISLLKTCNNTVKQLTVISTCASKIFLNGAQSLASAAIDGVLRSAAVELRNLEISHIYIDGSETSYNRLIEIIAQGNRHSHMFIDKNGKCYTEHIVNIEHIEQNAYDVNKQKFIETAENCTIVTGGTRGIALSLVNDLCQNKSISNVVLLSRSEPSAENKATIETLRRNGNNIHWVTVDAANAHDMYNLHQHINCRYRITKVFHAAGIVNDSSISNMTQQQIVNVFKPKVVGAQNLHSLTQSAAVNTFVLFSSIASTVGSSGQANYAAANACLDALSYHYVQNGCMSLSINWGSWAEVGMAVKLQKWLEDRGILSMKPHDAFVAFDYAIRQHYIGQYSITSFNRDHLFTYAPHLEELFDGVSQRKRSATLTPDTTLQITSSECNDVVTVLQRIDVMQIVEKTVRDVLQFDDNYEIDEEKGFMEMGMDSLTSVDFRNTLQNYLGTAVKVSSTVVFDYPNVAALVKHIQSKMDTMQPTIIRATAPTVNVEAKQQQEQISTVNAIEHQLISSMGTVSNDDVVCVIGMSCCLPNTSTNVSNYWAMLRSGIDGMVPVPPSRWHNNDFYDARIEADDKLYTTHSGYVRQGIDMFDAAFFGIAPTEAQTLDPQQRLLLEHTWFVHVTSSHCIISGVH